MSYAPSHKHDDVHSSLMGMVALVPLPPMRLAHPLSNFTFVPHEPLLKRRSMMDAGPIADGDGGGGDNGGGAKGGCGGGIDGGAA